MKVYLQNLLWKFIVGFLVVSCGVAKEVRESSEKLVHIQKTSLENQIQFHQSALDGLNTFIDIEKRKSDQLFHESNLGLNESLIEELENIYSDANLTATEKIVQEEKARLSIAEIRLKIESNYNRRSDLIANARYNLNEASKMILLAEKEKTEAIQSLNEYLQTKRPSDTILEIFNVEMSQVMSFVGSANEAIDKAKKNIDELK